MDARAVEVQNELEIAPQIEGLHGCGGQHLGSIFHSKIFESKSLRDLGVRCASTWHPDFWVIWKNENHQKKPKVLMICFGRNQKTNIFSKTGDFALDLLDLAL